MHLSLKHAYIYVYTLSGWARWEACFDIDIYFLGSQELKCVSGFLYMSLLMLAAACDLGVGIFSKG